MRLLVTGGAGFIGSHFVRKCFDGSFPEISGVTVLDKLTYAGNLKNLDVVSKNREFNFVKGDICDPIIVRNLLGDKDAIINFAAESHVDRSIESSSEFVKTNISGVQVLLDAIKNKGKGKRFVQISTDEVYGSIDQGSWTEESPLLPNSPYSASKAGADLLVRSYFRTHSLDVLITRCSNNYGPFHYPEKLIPLFITNIIENKKIPVYGTGQNIRDWLHVDDHCTGIYKVLKGGRSGEIYNIGGGRELSNIEITKLILNIMGSDETAIEFVEDRKGHDQRYSVNWSKIRNELAYQPKISFEQGLSNTIDWYLTNNSWWKSLKKTNKNLQNRESRK
jgi:dTDP-glucose 4,6-dehydratase